MILITIIISALFGGGIIFYILYPKTKTAQKIDEQTASENILLRQEQEKLILDQTKLLQEQQKLRSANDELTQVNVVLIDTQARLKTQNDNLTAQQRTLEGEIHSLSTGIVAIEAQAQESARIMYDQEMKATQERLNRDIEERRASFALLLEEAQVSYDVERQALETQLENLRRANSAAIEAAKRAEEMRIQQDDYRIQWAPADADEIALLREVGEQLRNAEPLNKVIWKWYYEKPTNNLIGRVIGQGQHTGIYKITNIKNQMCYIGQSVNIGDRWKQHIKRGLGAETPTRNKLYPAMMEIGPENFTFEIIEECDRSQLDEREDFWQEYYQAREFGDSIKSG